ncbi:Ku protein [Piscinibacter gummiphilus]|uniref:Non-homologous end joining protein Ku n=1 Tax=Piscinibacter gummiphilus TaxID=946333 RepID=A0ABZ0CRU2_9BURK|nr:Ku protein [Piscinibacter gummiphilus]WOB07659.1 Ku protein [Piscinibacter gummiphilus]
MATASRSLWKGAISFGLVHIPVSLHSASTESGVDFDWLDKRSMDPVGYKRINKRTGREITKENIVKGIEYENEKYVLLSDEEIEAVYPRSTQAIEIEAFVSMNEIPFVYLDRPYYLAPVAKGQKVYALLREALLKSERVGLARVVIHTKQHLAALVPAGPALVLNLLRWSDEIRTWEDLALPKEGVKANGITERELEMAGQLIDDMTVGFDPTQFADRFKEQVMALVERKVESGETETVLEPEEQPLPKGADVVDLTALLQQSLKDRGEPKHKAASRKKKAA